MKRSNRGESLIETLISMFIIALGMAILSAAISLSARMNEQANSKSELSFANLNSSAPLDDGHTAKVKTGEGIFTIKKEFPIEVKLYEFGSGDSNEMYFYVFP